MHQRACLQIFCPLLSCNLEGTPHISRCFAHPRKLLERRLRRMHPKTAVRIDQNILRPEVCRAFDMMHRRMELTSGAQRCHIHSLLVEQIKAKGLYRRRIRVLPRPVQTRDAAPRRLGTRRRTSGHDHARPSEYQGSCSLPA